MTQPRDLLLDVEGADLGRLQLLLLLRDKGVQLEIGAHVPNAYLLLSVLELGQGAFQALDQDGELSFQPLVHGPLVIAPLLLLYWGGVDLLFLLGPPSELIIELGCRVRPQCLLVLLVNEGVRGGSGGFITGALRVREGVRQLLL